MILGHRSRDTVSRPMPPVSRPGALALAAAEHGMWQGAFGSRSGASTKTVALSRGRLSCVLWIGADRLIVDGPGSDDPAHAGCLYSTPRPTVARCGVPCRCRAAW